MSERKNNTSGSEQTAGLHDGHRERMRTKFKSYGDRVFATYELLEMLLYHIIPYKDTNPTSRRLMMRFSDLDGIAGATAADILSVEGIGAKTADFLTSVFKIYKDFDETDSLFAGEKIMTKTSAGDFFVNYFSAVAKRDGVDKHRTVAAMLDSDMRLLSLTEPYDLDFGSGAVQSRPFIDAAVAAHATTIVIAHNHPFGPLFPSQADRASNKMIRAELDGAGITLLEHYVVSGNEYVTVMNTGAHLNLNQNDVYRISKDGSISLSNHFDKSFTNNKIRVLMSILSLVFKEDKALEMSEALSERFVRLCDVFYADMYVLKTILGSELPAVYLKLFFALYVRQKSDRFVFGKPHTEEEIAEYFTALLGYEPFEKVYAMMFDSRGRPQSCEFVAEGTVDTSNLPPRRLLEIAKRHEASGIALAHNHPSSGVTPSNDDVGATVAVKSLFESVGISFLSHYIVSNDDFCILDEQHVRYKKDFEI